MFGWGLHLGTRPPARVDHDDVEAPPPFPVWDDLPRAPTAIQLILHDLGFAPVQSDGEILVACCLEWVKKDKVANPDAVVFDPRPWTRIVGLAPHHGDGQVQPGLQCALQRRAAHLAADGQVHEQHPGAAGLANEDHVGSGHQTEPGPAHRPIVLLLGGQMVDPLGAVVEEIQGLGGVPRDGLPDPHDQQGQDGLHPPPRNPRQVSEVAQRRLGEAGRASQGRG